jgi:hypothetical protein
VKLIRNLYLLLLAFTSGKSILAQTTPTYFYTENNIDHHSGYKAIDTNINRIEIFDPVHQQLFFQHLGNFGTAARSTVFSQTRDAGFYYGFRPFMFYHFQPQHTKYIQTKRPFTDISYAQGQEELLFLKLTHAQNINPRWNVGIDFLRAKADGFQPRTATSIYAFQTFTSYKSKDLRYLLLGNITFNRANVHEGGGIGNDSLYKTLTRNNKAVFSKLSNAENRYRSRSAYIKQYYRWGQKQYTYNNKDTLYNFITRSTLSLTLHADEERFIFKNLGFRDSSILPNQFYDTTFASSDSAYVGRFQQRIQYHYIQTVVLNPKRYFQFDTLKLVAGGGITNQLINVAQQPYIRYIQNTLVEGKLLLQDEQSSRTIAGFSGWYGTTGYNAGDYHTQLLLGTGGKKWLAQVILENRRHRPDFVFELFKSNAFIWENQFAPTQSSQIELQLQTRNLARNWNIRLIQHSINNMVVLQDITGNLSPIQLAESISIQQIAIEKTFKLWRFYLEHALWYQQSNSQMVPVPEFSAFIRYSYRAKFYGISKFQIGFDAFYNSAWYAMGYNPALRMFFAQNQTTTGNYPLVDPFVACEVKKAAFFIKYIHANQNLIREGMFSTPHYPFQQANLRIGLRWRFYD